MSTKNQYTSKETLEDHYVNSIRTIIETAFYQNNVKPLNSISQAYELAKESNGTIVLDMDVYKPELLGLPSDAKVLLFNDGDVSGRAASARHILGSYDHLGQLVVKSRFEPIIKEAIYEARNTKQYHLQSYIGLDPSFMVKAHLCIPVGEENIAYSWLSNFQPITEHYQLMYQQSTPIDEGDLFIYSNPQWKHPDFPMGLAFFDPMHNCACILGMRYFGEHKKGTLTLAWALASRHGFVSCHGGLKRYQLSNHDFVLGVFGLSGSGKSTLTHAHHNHRFEMTILHDDAFVMKEDGSFAVALEPAYFDKTQDYPSDHPDNKYLLTVQNNGVTLNHSNQKVLVTGDVRNGNGRAVKSKLWSPNREDVFLESCQAIVWLMKDPSLPPALKITDPILAATMGATLATKRTSAERLSKDVDMNQLVIEPFANPFRTYPLADDYHRFKTLLSQTNVQCYIFNTGHFLEQKVTPSMTLNALESIILNQAEFVPFGPLDSLYYLPIESFTPNFNDKDYLNLLVNRFEDRLDFIQNLDTINSLPLEAVKVLTTCIEHIKN